MKDLKELYNALKADGAPIHDTYEQFKDYMTSGPQKGYAHRKALYDALKADGAPIHDTYEQFSKDYFAPKQKSINLEMAPAKKRVSAYNPDDWKAKANDNINKVLNASTDELLAAPKDPEKRTLENNRRVIDSAFKSHDFAGESVGKGMARAAGLDVPDHNLGITPTPHTPDIPGQEPQQPQNPKFLTDSQFKGVTTSPSGELKPRYQLSNGSITDSFTEADTHDANARKQRLQLKVNQDNERYANLTNAGKLREAQKELDKVNADIERYKADGDDYNLNGMFALRRQVQEKVDKLQRLTKKDEGKQDGFWAGAWDVVSDPSTWSFGAVGLADNLKLKAANDKLERGEHLTETEKRLLAAKHSNGNLDAKDSWMYRMGEMGGEMLPFMVDFAATGGLISIADAASKGALKGAMSAFTSKMTAKAAAGLAKVSPKLANTGFGRFTTRVLGAAPEQITKAVIMSNTVQAAKTSADAIDRKLGAVQLDADGNFSFENPKNWGAAIWQAQADNMVENYSEQFGLLLPGLNLTKRLGKVSANLGAKLVSNMLLGLDKSMTDGTLKTFNNVLDKAGIQNIGEEITEEYVGQAARTLLNLDDAYQPVYDDNGNPVYETDKNGKPKLDDKGNPIQKRKNNFLNTEFHKDIIGGMALTMGAMGMMKHTAAGGLSGVNYMQRRHNVSKASKRAETLFGADIWDGLRQSIDQTTNDDMADRMNSLAMMPNMTPAQAKAAMDYCVATLAYRGANLANIAQQRNPNDKPEEPGQPGASGGAVDANDTNDTDNANDAEQQANQSYQDGYNATDPEELEASQTLLDFRRQRLVNSYGEEFVKRLESDPLNIIAEIEDADERKQAIDWYNAQVTVNGINQRAADDAEIEIAGVHAQLEKFAFEDTQTIQPIIIKDGKTHAYYLAGNVAQDEQGNILIDESDPEIMIVDPQSGKVSMIPPSDIEFIGQEIALEDAKKTAEEEIRKRRQLPTANSTTNNPTTENPPTPDPTTRQPEPDNGLNDPTRNHDAFPDNWKTPYEGKPVTAARYTVTPQGNGVMIYRDEQGNDAIVLAATNDQQAYAGYFRVYDKEGNPTNRWSAKFENNTPDKETFRDLMQGAQQSMPEGHELTEVTSISTDGLRNLANQLRHGYELQHDDNGEIVTQEVAVNMMARNNDLGIRNYQAGNTSSAHVAQDEYKDIARKLIPYLEALGLTKYNIHWEDNTLYVDVPVLKSTRQAEAQTQTRNETPTVETPTTENSTTGNATTDNTPTPDSQLTTDNSTTQQLPETASSRVPVDEKGQPVYEQADPETAWDALTERVRGNADTAARMVANNIARLEEQLGELTKRKPKKFKTLDEEIEYENQLADQIDAIKTAINHWKKMAVVPQNREAERRRVENEQRRQRQAEAEQAQREAEKQAQLDQEADDLANVPEFRHDRDEHARTRGYRNVDGKRVNRRPEQEMPQNNGKNAVKVKFNNDNIVDGFHVVRELEDIQPTHKDGKPNPEHFVLESQPKVDFSADREQHTQKAASNINPSEITEGATAFVGAPVTNRRGEVYQGTGRWNILEYMYNNRPEQAAIYKKYLMLLAAEGKLGNVTPEQIEAMKRPVAIRMTDVSDEEMVRLGNIPVDDNEAGGNKRMEASSTVSKMRGVKKYGDFVRKLLDVGAEEDASVNDLMRTNGYKVLKWMKGLGFINDTQFRSALKTNANGEVQLSEDCLADLRKMVEETVFDAAPIAMRDSWQYLPEKAKRSILMTAHKDYDSPATERVLTEVQQSVIAYAQIISYPGFKQAKDFKQALAIAHTWARQSSFDENSNVIVNGEKFSNFAIHLAALYHTEKQNAIRDHFNSMYELVQGTRIPTLFDAEDENYDPIPLVEAIKKVFDIEYRSKFTQPLNTTENEDNRRTALAGSDSAGTQGSDLGTAGTRGGEQSSQTEQSAQPGTRTDGDGRGSRDDSERKSDLQKKAEVDANERAEMASRIVDWLSYENLEIAYGKSREEIFELFGNELYPIAYLPSEFLDLLGGNINDPRIYCGKGYFIDHALRNHGKAGTQVKTEDVDVSRFSNIQAILDNPDAIKETNVDGKRTVVFIKKIGRYFAELTQMEEDGKILLYKSLFDQKKEPYAKLNDIRQKTTSPEGGESSISHAESESESAPAISLESRDDVKSQKPSESIDKTTNTADNHSDLQGDTALLQNPDVSDRKVNDSASNKQDTKQESSENVSTGQPESGKPSENNPGQPERKTKSRSKNPTGKRPSKKSAESSAAAPSVPSTDNTVPDQPQKPAETNQANETKPKRKSMRDRIRERNANKTENQPQRSAEEQQHLDDLKAALEALKNSQKNNLSMGGMSGESIEAAFRVASAGAAYGYDLMKKGIVKFADWAMAMIRDLGTAIKPHLKKIYGMIREDDSIDDNVYEEMDTSVRSYDIEEMISNDRKRRRDKAYAEAYRQWSEAFLDENSDEAKMTVDELKEEAEGLRADMAELSEEEEDYPEVMGECEGTLRAIEEEIADRESPRDAEVKTDATVQTQPTPHVSGGNNMETVMPVNMLEPFVSAINDVQKRHGDIDAYVQRALGYESVDALHKALGAEQIEGVALAIDQMEKGNAFIIGDMTGVGKGRQAAALLRYARKKGFRPVFITRTPELFSDIWRDLDAIGSGDMKPFSFNTSDITDKDGKVVHRDYTKKEKDEFFKKGVIPSDSDFVLLTYSQLSQDGKRIKRSAINALAKDNYLVMDESHTAGGLESAVGQVLREATVEAKGVTFLSATYAKRADSMGIYALRTVLGDTNATIDSLLQAIKRGGLPLQEEMSRGLVEGGQMVRRERDMTGVTIDWSPMRGNAGTVTTQYDNAVRVANLILEIQKGVTPILSQLAYNLKKSGLTLSPGQFSKFNFLRQILLAAKADEIADRAVEAIQQGRKPVIALGSTAESSMDRSFNPGDLLDNVSYRDILLDSLEHILDYKIKDDSGRIVDHGFIPIPTLMQDPSLWALYSMTRNLIESIRFDMPISPIDHITQRLEEAGYTVGELTGRNTRMRKQPDGKFKYEKRPKTDRKEVVRKFQNGNIDVMILNESGSTGISLHADKKCADQRPRRMLFAQSQLDTNVEVQMRGRIDRTGQIHRGEYVYLVSPIPAEKRLMMMLKAKLKSLDANTTSSQKTEFNQVDVADLANKYGDEAVFETLKDDDELAGQLGAEEYLRNDKIPEGFAESVVKQVTFLPVEMQERFYASATERFESILKYHDEMGTNELVTTHIPLNAETVKRFVFVEGSDPGRNNTFGEHTYLEEMEVDVLSKPMSMKEVRKAMKQLAEGQDPQTYLRNILDSMRDRRNNATQISKQEEEETIDAKLRSFSDSLDKNMSEADRNDAVKVERKRLEAKSLRNIERNASRIRKNADTVINSLNGLNVGEVMMVPNSLDTRAAHKPGILLGVRMGKTGTPSSCYAVFALRDSTRKIEIPLSKNNSFHLMRQLRHSSIETGLVTLDNWDKALTANKRETLRMLTGNILQGWAKLDPGDGKIVSFSTKDGQIRHGILLRNPKKLKGPDSSLATLRDKLVENMAQYQERRMARKPVDDLTIVSNDGKLTIEPSAKYIDVVFNTATTRNAEGKALREKFLKLKPECIRKFGLPNLDNLGLYKSNGGFLIRLWGFNKLSAEQRTGILETIQQLAPDSTVPGEWQVESDPKPLPDYPSELDTVESGIDYGVDIAERLYNQLSTDYKGQDELARKVFALAKSLPIKVVFGEQMKKGILGAFSNTGILYLRLSALKGRGRYSSYADGRAATILHETIHAVTSWALRDFQENEGKNLSENARQGCRELIEVYNAVHSLEHEEEQAYGLSSVHEMVAELANPKFRAWLAAKKLWRKIVDGIAKIFGYNNEGAAQANALQIAEEALDKILNGFDMGTWSKYASLKLPGRIYGRYESRIDNESDDRERLRNDLADLIMEANPMTDDYHTGVRSAKDVMLFDEILDEVNENLAEFGNLLYPDISRETFDEANKTGRITVYSSHPIKTGTFVTPSRMCAVDYAGGGHVHSKEVSVDEIAWIDHGEGQLALFDLSAHDKVVLEPDVPYTSIEQANRRFNEELQQQIDGTLPKDHIYVLGMPGEILLSAGFPNAEIQMAASRLAEKSRQTNHPFNIADVGNLVTALNNPIAVFNYGNKAKNVILDIERKGKHYLVGVHFNQTHRGAEVSDIRGIFPKDNAEWLNWISQNKSAWLDKEKIQRVIKQQRINLAEVPYLNLEDIAKVIKNFENPQLPEDFNTRYRIREEEPPRKTSIGYKVFVLKDGKLYPPMVANPNGEATPVGVWLDADAAPIAGTSKTGRQQVKAGGKGTQGGSGKLAYRPGWHLGTIPYALQFNRMGENGEKDLFPANFVWAEVEYADDVDYQDEAMSYGYNQNGKFQHSYAGLPKLPVNGSYKYRTNPNPETDPWIITGAMKVNRLLTPSEVDRMVRDAGRDPQKRQPGAVTDEQINQLNQQFETAIQSVDFEYSSTPAQLRDAAQSIASELGLVIDFIDASSALKGNKAKAKGWFDINTGRITVVVGSHTSVADIQKTILHEAVAHEGLRELLGDDFDNFLDRVYDAASDNIKNRIALLASKNGWNKRVATEEYLASLAEDTDFNKPSSWLNKVKRFFADMLLKAGFKIPAGSISDNELRYILWRSYQNLKDKAVSSPIERQARDIAMQHQLQVGNYGECSKSNFGISDEVEKINLKFNNELQHQIEGKLKDNHLYYLGMPGVVLSSTGVPYLPIQMSAKRLMDKATKFGHDYDLTDVRNLVMELQRPLAVFSYGDKGKMQNIIVEIENNDKKFIVGLSLNPIVNGEALQINSVRNVFPKHNAEWLNWITQGKMLYCDKEKIQALIDKQRTILADVDYLDLEDVAKIVENFENPKFVDDDMLRFRNGSFSTQDRVTAADQYERSVRSGAHQFSEAVQDSMKSLKTAMLAILAKGSRIEDIPDSQNPYRYENLMSSQIAAHQHQYGQRFFKPLLDEVFKLAGRSADERQTLTDYMMAKHGLERNKYMRDKAEQNNEDTERDFAGLCGLTGIKDWQKAEAQARQMVDDYEAAHNTAALWNAVNNATHATLAELYAAGIISEETYNDVTGMYDFYIPLRGWDETTSDEVYGYLTGPDGPLHGNVMKSAEGRSSKADDPIATIAQMADDAIRQGRRNIMKQRFLNFVNNHPSDLVSVNHLWLQFNKAENQWQPVFADITDDMTPAQVEAEVKLFEDRMQKLKAADPDNYKNGREAVKVPYKVRKEFMREHTVLVKRGGKTYVLTVNGNPRLAQALNGLTNPDSQINGVVGSLFKVGENINRHLSGFYTTRNPDFVISNFCRDMIYANTSVWVKESPAYAARFNLNIARCNPAVMGNLFHKWEQGNLGNGYLDSVFSRFMLNGGETGYTNVRDIEKHKKEIARNLNYGHNLGASVWQLLSTQLDIANRAVENTARFAAFLTSVETGRSDERAASDAKEISVNFNKKGAGDAYWGTAGQTKLGKLGSAIGGFGRAGYVFWNAGVQGLTNFGRLAKSNPKAIAMLSSLFALGYLMPLLASFMQPGDGDDDDKNAYYNLPEFVRRSNICIWADGKWVTVPLPVEFRAIYGLGELAMGVQNGKEGYDNAQIARNATALVSQILPLDLMEGGSFGFDSFVPSLAKPWWEIYNNTSWAGLPIAKDTPFNQLDPEYRRVYSNADSRLVDLSAFVSRQTGGSEYSRGAVEINPAKIEYLLNGYLGGLSSFPSKIIKSAETVNGQRDFDWRNIPLANRVLKTGDERTQHRKLIENYYSLRDRLDKSEHQLRGYTSDMRKGIDGAARHIDMVYNDPDFVNLQVFGSYEKQLDRIRKAIQQYPEGEVPEQLNDIYFSIMRRAVEDYKDNKNTTPNKKAI